MSITDFIKSISKTSTIAHTENTYFDVYLQVMQGGNEEIYPIERVCADNEEQAMFLAIIQESESFDEKDLEGLKEFYKKNEYASDGIGRHIRAINIVPLQRLVVHPIMDGKPKECSVYMPVTAEYDKDILEHYISL